MKAVEARATDLKLPTSAASPTLADEALRDHHTRVAYLARLLEAEHPKRAERRERRALIDTRFPGNSPAPTFALLRAGRVPGRTHGPSTARSPKQTPEPAPTSEKDNSGQHGTAIASHDATRHATRRSILGTPIARC